MKMPKIRNLIYTLGLAGAMLSGNVLAQLTVSLSDETGPADGSVTVFLDFQGDGNSQAFEGNVLWDGTHITSVDVSGCASGSTGQLALSCTDISVGDDGNLRIQLSAGLNALNDYTGTLVFQLAGTAGEGDVIPVVWDEDSLFGGDAVTGEEVEVTSTDGSITIEGDEPPGDCSLAIAPASHNFGTVAINGTASQSFTISNSGEDDCTGLMVDVDGAGFSLGATDCGGTLGAGESCSADVDFSPTAAGNFSGSLDADANEDSASAALSGAGSVDPVDPEIVAIPTMNAMGLALMALLMLMIGVVSVRTFRS